MILDVRTTFVIAGVGLSQTDKVKFVEPTAPCRGMGDEDALVGGRSRQLHWVSEDRLAGNVTFTIYLPPLRNGHLVTVRVCYLYDGSSEYTEFANVTVISNPTWWPETEKPVDPTYGLTQPTHQTTHNGELVTNLWQQ